MITLFVTTRQRAPHSGAINGPSGWVGNCPVGEFNCYTRSIPWSRASRPIKRHGGSDVRPQRKLNRVSRRTARRRDLDGRDSSTACAGCIRPCRQQGRSTSTPRGGCTRRWRFGRNRSGRCSTTSAPAGCPSFKDRTVVSVITSLSDHPTARSALRALGVDGSATYPKALAVLAGSHMLVRAS